jgi:adenylate cyclase
VLNPSFERGWRASAWLRLWAGDATLAIEHLETAMRLSPLFRNATDTVLMGAAHLFERRFDKAIAMFLSALDELPTNPAVHRYLAASYAHGGKFAEARQMIDALLKITPVIVPNTVQFRNPDHRELYLSGLRLAVRASSIRSR